MNRLPVSSLTLLVLPLVLLPATTHAQSAPALADLSTGFGAWTAMGTLDATDPLTSRIPAEAAGPCQGFLASAPAAILQIDAALDELRIRAATSRPDMLMLVLGPDGFVQCAQQPGHTPGVALTNPVPGPYQVVLGLAAAGESANFTLYVEEGPAPAPTVTGQGEGSGLPGVAPAEGIAQTVLEDALYARVNELQTCRERLHAADPSYTGQVLVQWSITTSGEVRDATVLSTEPPNAALGDCILEVVRGLRFDPPAQLTVVTFPFDIFPL